ncbi:MAG: hypothetical protein V1745_01500 [Patescibacteria group bacterium]
MRYEHREVFDMMHIRLPWYLDSDNVFHVLLIVPFALGVVAAKVVLPRCRPGSPAESLVVLGAIILFPLCVLALSVLAKWSTSLVLERTLERLREERTHLLGQIDVAATRRLAAVDAHIGILEAILGPTISARP